MDKTVDISGVPIQRSLHVRLRTIEGVYEGQQWALDTTCEVIVGRAEPAQIRLPKELALSREHFCLRINDAAIQIIDLGSRNGTWLNGVRVIEAPLADGDIIRVGETKLQIVISASAATENRGDTSIGEQTEPPSVIPRAGSDSSSLATEIFSQPTKDGGNDTRVNTNQADLGKPGNARGATLAFIGSYEPLEIIGQGGMATVYAARHRKGGEHRALKLIRADVGSFQKQVTLFAREASVMMRLNHRRIVTVYEFGIHEGIPFLVMELLKPIDLQAILASQSKPRRIISACWVIAKVLQALEYAHANGVVHRDIKPSNILAYFERGKLQVKLGDFGLAKSFEDAGLSAITDEGSIRGTLSFMAPEHLSNSLTAGPLSDIYSCGVCLFVLLTGETPMAGCQPSTVKMNGLPATLRELVQRAVAINPQKRFRSATEMLASLKPFHGRG